METKAAIEYKLNQLDSLDVKNITTGTLTTTGDLTLTGNLAVTGNISVTGAVTFSGLPTSDPTVAGQLWSNLGVLTVSAG